MHLLSIEDCCSTVYQKVVTLEASVLLESATSVFPLSILRHCTQRPPTVHI